MNDAITAAVCIGADHPCLPGHFPGDPVVPGVVLLDQIAAVLEAAGAGRLSRLVQVKFLAPLRPDETAELVVRRNGTGVRFQLDRAGTPILRGEGELASPDGAAA